MQGTTSPIAPLRHARPSPSRPRVEERLGFENKKDIEEFGEENFIQECKDYADEQLEGLQSDFQDFGVWMDWDDPYRTVEPEYMEAAWWGFANAADRGLVEKGHRSISQCPRCETAIANNEVEYEDVEDPSIYVKFDLEDRGLARHLDDDSVDDPGEHLCRGRRGRRLCRGSCGRDGEENCSTSPRRNTRRSCGRAATTTTR